jgi:hypothetical protein
MARRKFMDERCHKCKGGPTERDIRNGGMDRFRACSGVKGQKWSEPVFTCSDCLVDKRYDDPRRIEAQREILVQHTQSSSGG